jgi:hypothetical protein
VEGSAAVFIGFSSGQFSQIFSPAARLEKESKTSGKAGGLRL